MRKTNLVCCFALSFILLFCITSCGNGNNAENEETPLTHRCESVCEDCGGCMDFDCTEEICKTKCPGSHVNLPEIDIDDLN
jgi:hypothetical protein